MKKIIFILLACSSFAKAQTNESNAFTCINTLLPNMARFTHKIPDRPTIIHAFKDGWGGGTFSDEITSGMLLIENKKVSVCKMEWSISEMKCFKVADSAGSFKYTYEFGKDMPFRDGSCWPSQHPCKDVTREPSADQFLKRIVANKLIELNQDVNQQISAACSQVVTDDDLKAALKRKEDALRTAPSTNVAPSTSNNMKKATKNAEDSL